MSSVAPNHLLHGGSPCGAPHPAARHEQRPPTTGMGSRCCCPVSAWGQPGPQLSVAAALAGTSPGPSPMPCPAGAGASTQLCAPARPRSSSGGLRRPPPRCCPVGVPFFGARPKGSPHSLLRRTGPGGEARQRPASRDPLPLEAPSQTPGGAGTAGAARGEPPAAGAVAGSLGDTWHFVNLSAPRVRRRGAGLQG